MPPAPGQLTDVESPLTLVHRRAVERPGVPLGTMKSRTFAALSTLHDPLGDDI